ncbi:MAG TPA: DotU family type IV/VI secretion system protein [Bryobacteraceae bacterium]|nr:DotU family type IV/VI secretion system protein [Bryobacteraceae bacterium]
MTPQPAQRRQENLAFVFQELLTAGERLRAHRQQVTDAATFRAQLWAGVKSADEEARRRGYSAEDIELAIFAVVAFLDESILNLRLPVFADWPRQPLQEERYGHHVAGEIFFQNLQKLLGRTDSQELADLLEVYSLCLLLGFAGRYSLGGHGDLRSISAQTSEKIQRIRRTGAELSPGWRLPGNDPVRPAGGDPWVMRLAIGAGACFALMMILFIGFYFLLNSGVGSLQTIAGAVL